MHFVRRSILDVCESPEYIMKTPLSAAACCDCSCTLSLIPPCGRQHTIEDLFMRPSMRFRTLASSLFPQVSLVNDHQLAQIQPGAASPSQVKLKKVRPRTWPWHEKSSALFFSGNPLKKKETKAPMEVCVDVRWIPWILQANRPPQPRQNFGGIHPFSPRDLGAWWG